MKLSLIQLKNLQNNDKNIDHAIEMIEKAAAGGADFVVLPEMFTCPYQASKFPLYAQEEGGTNWKKLSEAAKKFGVYLCAGSMPELEVKRDCCEHVENIYNTSYVFDRNGNQIARHRKAHLFDVDIKGGPRFKESDSLTAGNEITTFETEFGTFGLMICFDIRFPEMARLIQLKGAKMILVPAAFNMTSGPKWWELMFRTRSVDNQIFTAGCSPARDTNANYVAWGHSMVANPWGTVLGELQEDEEILTVEIDFSEVEKVRAQVPLTTARRVDLYKLEEI
ncbi:MAG: carbon-nitrogen hydrolase family protein [Treponema sp.]|nr:carbon-nitrogen hydrolase family protein [Candidatus Treponema equifaecale]